jgi:hypothetical protein
MLQVLLACALLNLLALAGLGWLVYQLYRDRGAADTTALDGLAQQLEAPFTRLYAELRGEHDRLRQLTSQAETLAGTLAELEAIGVEEELQQGADPGDLQAARLEARRLLTAGQGVSEVAGRTGLPEGEVKILANLLKAKLPNS